MSVEFLSFVLRLTSIVCREELKSLQTNKTSKKETAFHPEKLTNPQKKIIKKLIQASPLRLLTRLTRAALREKMGMQMTSAEESEQT